MLNLTNNQIQAIHNLHEQIPSLFEGVIVSTGKDGTYVNIFSVPNADYGECDKILFRMFPDGIYEKPVLINREDGTFCEVYPLVDPSKANITLCMKRAPEQKEEVKS